MQLKHMALELTGRAVVTGQNKVILRKLFVAVRHILSAALRTCLEFGCNDRLHLLQSNCIPGIRLDGLIGYAPPSTHFPTWVPLENTCLTSCQSWPKRWKPLIYYHRASSFQAYLVYSLNEQILTFPFLPFSNRVQMQTTLASAVPMVVQAISDCIELPAMERSPHELNSALKCLQAWMSVLPAKYDVLPSIL